MKRVLCSGCVFLLLFVAVVVVAPKDVNAEALFEENFESHALGTFPSDEFYAVWGGWEVADDVGNKVLRSVWYNTSNFLMYTTERFPGNASIEFMTRYSGSQLDLAISNQLEGQRGAGAWQISFWNYQNNSWAYGYYYTVDGINYTGAEEYVSTFATQPGTWYNMRLALEGGLAKLYIDDQLLIEKDFSLLIPFEIDNFYYAWGTWGVRELDDIQVNAVPEPATMLLLGSGLVGLAGFRKRFKRR